MAAAVDKIDMSLDDIIKLNKKKLASIGGAGERGQGAGRGRGRGGRTRGVGRGRRESNGVSPLNRNDTGFKQSRRGSKSGRFSNRGARGAIRGQAGRGTRGTGRGARGASRGTRGASRGTRGAGRVFRGKTFYNSQDTSNGFTRGSIGFYNRRGSTFQRGGASKRGFASSTLSLTRGAGRRSARGRSGPGNINQQKDAMVEVIKKARRTLQQLNAQQKRQNVVSQKRGIAQSTVSPTRPVPEKKRRWNNNRSVQPYSQDSSSSQVLTVLVDNKRSPNNSQRNKPKKISNKLRQQVMQNDHSSKQALNSFGAQKTRKKSYISFSAPTTSVSLNQRFGGHLRQPKQQQQQQQQNLSADTDRQVFF